MILVFILGILLVIRVRISSPGKFNKALNALTNIRLMRQMIREETSVVRHQFMLLAVFCLNASLIIYLILKYQEIAVPYLSGVVLYLAIVLSIGVLYSLKSLFIRTVEFLSNGDHGLEEYHHNVFLVARVFGLVLFPVALIFAYSPLNYFSAFLWATIGLTLLAFTFRTLRGFMNSLHAGNSLFYIFFYICTFEILPILVFYKALLE